MYSMWWGGSRENARARKPCPHESYSIQLSLAAAHSSPGDTHFLLSEAFLRSVLHPLHLSHSISTPSTHRAGNSFADINKCSLNIYYTPGLLGTG